MTSTTEKNFLPVITFARIAIRRAFRDKTAIFFIFLFPLIFLFVFGGIFGKKSDVSFKIALVNQSSSDFSKQFVSQMSGAKVFKIDKEASSLDSAKEKMSRGQLDAAIVLPQDFGVVNRAQYPSGQAKIYCTQNSQSA